MIQPSQKENQGQDCLATEGRQVLMPQGIIGFHHLKKYDFKLIPDSKSEGKNPGVFWLLKSQDCQNITFILLSSWALQDRIEMEVTDILAVADRYGIQASMSELVVFFVTTIDRSNPEEKRITVNIRAPVVMDLKQNQAWQVILTDSKYPINYSLLPLMEG